MRDEDLEQSPLLVSAGFGALRLADVGGKAASLARLTGAGFRVPEAVFLTCAFFSFWLERLEETSAWADFLRVERGPWSEISGALKDAARNLEAGAEQRAALDEARTLLESWGRGEGVRPLCAVRSSSPDEDLEHASFAGGYETVLGVSAAGLEDAVRKCFVSCFDERVFAYKQQHGFDVHRPRIAAVVQRQLSSEIAGVGFSLNPVTNDFDEAVIDANWGLGETVVSGEVRPDHFVVHKPTLAIRERRIEDKAVSRWLGPDGGVALREGHRSADATLEDDQVAEVAKALIELEALHGHPVDVEWAYAEGALHLLQARPVTTYVPLAAEMQTEPGRRRILYQDSGLSDGLTLNGPVSTLGLDFWRVVMEVFARPFVGDTSFIGNPQESLISLAGARPYVNLSQVFPVFGPQRMAREVRARDALLADTLEAVDRSEYAALERPEGFSWWKVPGAVLRGLWRSRSLWLKTLAALLRPARFLGPYRENVARFERDLASVDPAATTPSVLAKTWGERFYPILLEGEMPALFGWMIGFSLLQRGFGQESGDAQELADRMNRGYEGDIVVEMGIEMHRMAHMLEPSAYDDLPALAADIERRAVPEGFLSAWDAFRARFGARGPMEMDPSRSRYGDDPELLLGQLSQIAAVRDGFDPERVHREHIESRQQAFALLSGRLGFFKRRLLCFAHRLIELYAGERDTPKYHLVMLVDLLRRSALELGDRLVRAGRLDERGDVFHLTLPECDASQEDAHLDLRPRVALRKQFFRKVERQVREFPLLIDSRGRILRPERRVEDGELVGLGVSPGVARGRVRILRDPREKKVLPGDVLVAYTTDPGWTPLFINASAIVLQIGGMMQHGGLVAREYGKPCVAGIDGVLTRLRDDQLVEVDGSAGVVRVVDSPGC